MVVQSVIPLKRLVTSETSRTLKLRTVILINLIKRLSQKTLINSNKNEKRKNCQNTIFARIYFRAPTFCREIFVQIFAHFELLREIARKLVRAKISTNKVIFVFC